MSAAVHVDGGRGWASFGLLIFELNLIVWVGYCSDRNAGSAIKELEVRRSPAMLIRMRAHQTGRAAVAHSCKFCKIKLQPCDVLPLVCLS